MAREIKIRVTKEITEIHTCPVTDEEYELIQNGDLTLDDVVYGCGMENNKVEEVDSDYSYERAGSLEVR
jgi:hypothetical protein